MFDFSKGKFHKYRLSEVNFSEFETAVSPMLTDKESLLFASLISVFLIYFTLNARTRGISHRDEFETRNTKTVTARQEQTAKELAVRSFPGNERGCLNFLISPSPIDNRSFLCYTVRVTMLRRNMQWTNN